MLSNLSVRIFASCAVFAIVAYAHQPESSNVEGILARSRGLYEAAISDFKDDLSKLRSDIVQRLLTVDVQNELLAKKLAEVKSNLTLFEVLSDQSKSCYDSQINNLPSAVTARLAISNCRSAVFRSFFSITSGVERVLTTLQNYFNRTFQTLLTECLRNNGNTTTTLNYTICVNAAVNNLASAVITNRRSFATQLQQARFSGERSLSTAFECSFNVIFDQAFANGQVQALIQQCSDQRNGGQFCDNRVTLRSFDTSSVTIRNPFFGINSNARCVLFELLSPRETPPSRGK